MTICLRKNRLLGWQLQVPLDLWATKTQCIKHCLCQLKVIFLKKNWLGNDELLNKTFFVFSSTCRIFVSAEYSADNFLPNTGPKASSVDQWKVESVKTSVRFRDWRPLRVKCKVEGEKILF
jgi:hypothetical protein